ncbi:RNA-directed DNA polymerase, eukaryota, partial [Tanacetum coccineum]
MERFVSKDEIKRAVWDCGLDRSPGLGGFTFRFYLRYWNLIEVDVNDVVFYFFHHGTFPKGGNSSFIALIPKTQDAKMVKDFRPISLIGSLYKIIAKILANRLVGVLGELVNEVQSDFVANRQILDGPFILNEIIQWCKSNKKQTMVFKVDFEKAFDSVGGSILVNGSPTIEFQFHKGLKQGDPLSSFLFILIMESLHLSFQNVVREGMFKGVSIGPSLNLSHLFHVDDVKSKLMGIAVEDDKVSQAALSIGCSTFTTLFSYLGVKVGGMMSRTQAWNEIVNKSETRLSKWKMKTLSIAPLQVLNRMEAIRCRFFNGVDTKEKRMTWVSWKNTLASKDKGGLGVLSFYALNRSLMFKWVWRFRNDNNSLWVSVIKALHGENGSLGTSVFALESNKDITVADKLAHEDVGRWVWCLTGSGEFSVASARRYIDDHMLPGVSSKTTWLKAVPIKINVHAWKVKLDSFPT